MFHGASFLRRYSEDIEIGVRGRNGGSSRWIVRKKTARHSNI
jgi:hypothetical protein